MQDAYLFEMARALQGQGRFDDARKLYRQILKRAPRHFQAQCQLAVLAYQEGRIAEALKENERALRIDPNVAGLHNNRGAFLMMLERFREAAASFEQAVRLDPRDAQARNNLAGALFKRGRPAEALGHVDAAVAMAPGYAKAHADRGSILIALGRVDEAVASCDRAIALAPGDWDGHETRGLALLQLGRREEALASFEAAAAAAPERAALHVNRGTVLEQLGREADASEAYARALSLDPAVRLARGSLLHLRMKTCDWAGYAQEAEAVLAALARGDMASPPFPVLALPSSGAQQRKAGALYASYAAGVAAPALAPQARADRIRIAYVSADLFNHAVGQALAPVVEAHDKSRFEVWGVSIAPRPEDDLRRRLRAAMDGFIDGAALSDDALVTRIRAIGADIAVDLTGYTMNHRPRIFARRVAPCQLAWLGYPATTGSDAIDGLIADDVVVPPDDERHFSERILRLPSSVFPASAARPIAARPLTRAEAGLPEQGTVFCCFNNAYKITPDVFDVWTRLLKAVDGSVLWLSVRGEAGQTNLRAEATRRGVTSDRLVFAPSVPLPVHLARHGLADLFLDTFHYGAHSTAVDALCGGLPVLTRRGETYSGRVAASLLTHLGLPQLVVPDMLSYERKALDLVGTAGALAELKQSVAARVPGAFDIARFMQGFETLLARAATR